TAAASSRSSCRPAEAASRLTDPEPFAPPLPSYARDRERGRAVSGSRSEPPSLSRAVLRRPRDRFDHHLGPLRRHELAQADVVRLSPVIGVAEGGPGKAFERVRRIDLLPIAAHPVEMRLLHLDPSFGDLSCEGIFPGALTFR